MDSVVMGQPVHPRVRGEQTGMLRVMYSGSGSSPRARGTVHKPNSPPALARFIPACAGNRRAGSRACGRWPVHPRVRGEQTEGGCMEYRGYGSSPRARGTGNCANDRWTFRRFIPACAGNRTCTARAPGWVSVHPRVRGEQRGYHINCLYYAGSSPRARGTARNLRRRRAAPRFIPACAGNSCRVRAEEGAGPVHPRVRGEQGDVERCHAARVGSSPRARGTEGTRPDCGAAHRFIPACAGNSGDGYQSTHLKSVHPRVRGEQQPTCSRYCLASGSSPRARGTGHWRHVLERERRFIPACAGNSTQAAVGSSGTSVHPRVRGEQDPVEEAHCSTPGSSPRARGTEHLLSIRW